MLFYCDTLNTCSYEYVFLQAESVVQLGGIAPAQIQAIENDVKFRR